MGDVLSHDLVIEPEEAQFSPKKIDRQKIKITNNLETGIRLRFVLSQDMIYKVSCPKETLAAHESVEVEIERKASEPSKDFLEIEYYADTPKNAADRDAGKTPFPDGSVRMQLVS